MRKTLLTLAVAAAALTAGISASQAGGYGYDNDYDSGYTPSYHATYYQPSCHTVTVRVYDEYSCEYVYRTKEVCN